MSRSRPPHQIRYAAWVSFALPLTLHPQSYQRTGHSVENLLDFAKAAGLSPIAQDGDVYAFAQLDVRSR